MHSHATRFGTLHKKSELRECKTFEYKGSKKDNSVRGVYFKLLKFQTREPLWSKIESEKVEVGRSSKLGKKDVTNISGGTRRMWSNVCGVML